MPVDGLFNLRVLISASVIPPYAQSRVRHLVRPSSSILQDQESCKHTLKNVCASVLALDPQRVEDNVPLSSYGLDSLTSVRLSSILKGAFGLVVTQMQLLAVTMTRT